MNQVFVYANKEGDFIRTYKTAEIAGIIGVHPNTIRFYEDMGLLPAIPRTESGYRIFNDWHIELLKLLRTAFHVEIISSRLRNEAFEIVKTAAAGDVEGAYRLTLDYLMHIKVEKANAEEAIHIVHEIIEDNKNNENSLVLTGRGETAKVIGITIDVLRDWERNGLIQVPRNSEGRREYGIKELNRLKIIRTLRNAHYSMMSILRMLKQLDSGRLDLKTAINTPGEDEDIVCAADRYITSLSLAKADASKMLNMLSLMK